MYYRYEKLAEQEEVNYQQQRRRLFGEVQQEKEKLAAQFHQQKITLEQQQREMEEEKLRYTKYNLSAIIRTCCLWINNCVIIFAHNISQSIPRPSNSWQLFFPFDYYLARRYVNM